MKKIDGKEYYTFVGLINRMDACRDRDYKFTEKDIPEEVEFRETTYKLSNDKKFYAHWSNGVTLAEVVGEEYGTDMYKYLTAHEFIVTPKEKIFLTSEEREFIRLSNTILHDGLGICIVERLASNNEFLKFVFKDYDGWVNCCEWVNRWEIVHVGNKFQGLEPGKKYSLKDLKIYE